MLMLAIRASSDKSSPAFAATPGTLGSVACSSGGLITGSRIVADASTRPHRIRTLHTDPHFGDCFWADHSLFWGISQPLTISAWVNPRDREYQDAYRMFRRRLMQARKEAGVAQR